MTLSATGRPRHPIERAVHRAHAAAPGEALDDEAVRKDIVFAQRGGDEGLLPRGLQRRRGLAHEGVRWRRWGLAHGGVRGRR